MQPLDEPLSLGNSDSSTADAWKIIASGIACHCAVALYYEGALTEIMKQGSLDSSYIKKSANPAALLSALQTLRFVGILSSPNEHLFFLTKLGRYFFDLFGIVLMNFSGYAGLLHDQVNLMQGNFSDISSKFNEISIAESAALLAKNFFIPAALPICKEFYRCGRICDLGCGSGLMLSELCSELNANGLGIEISKDVLSKTLDLNNSKITIQKGDVSNLKEVWPDVTFLIQCHVFHDFSELKDCLRILNDVKLAFPAMEYFIFIDSLSPEGSDSQILPGFDYDHGLQGKQMRTHSQTLELFKLAKFTIMKEQPVQGMPKTYIWVLKPS